MSYPSSPSPSNYGVPNPYQDTGFYGPPPKPSSGGMPWWGWLLMVLVGGGALLGCGCCGGVMMFGLNVMGEELGNSLRGNPVMEEHIGTLTKSKVDFAKWAAEDDNDIVVVRVEGSKGKGYVYAETDDAQETVLSGKLRMDDGQEYDLFPGGPGM